MSCVDNRVRFAHFEADLASGELFSKGEKVPLQEKPFQLLRLLLSHPGEVVTREHIYAVLWRGTHVDHRVSLNTAMRKLRAALREDARQPALIETVEPGYRLRVQAQFPVSTASSERSARLRLALAPFQNLGPDEEEYLADGLTEQMIQQLAHTHKDISIIAPFSVLRYKHSGKEPAQIGRELRADYVLSGSVGGEQGRVHVTARLIRSRDQTCLWSETYSSDEAHLFMIQDEITHQIAHAIVPVLPVPKDRPSSLSTDAGTYAKYLKGCFFANKWSAAGFQKAIEIFQQVIAQDPGFALAHASLAKLYMAMSAQGILPPAVINERTRSAASEALRLCPGLADALTALGWSQLFYDGDIRAAEESFLRSIESNPSVPHGYEGYSHLLTAAGRHPEALELASRACEVDPLSPFAGNLLACTFYFARQFDQALAQALRNVETEPDFPITLSSLGWMYEALGALDKAIECHRASVRHNPGSPAMLANLAHTLGLAGDREEAGRILQQVLAARASLYVSPYWIAMAYCGLGENASALEWLATGIEERDGWRMFYAVDPKLDSLMDDARFQVLLQRVGV